MRNFFRPASIALLSILLLAGCDTSPQEKNLKNRFAEALALAENLQGTVLVGTAPLFGTTLLEPQNTLSTGEGHARVTHENGVIVQLRPNARLTVDAAAPHILDGSAWVEFPRGRPADAFWGGWKLRGQDAVVEIAAGENAQLRVIAGEILAVRDGARFLVKTGHALALGPNPAVAPLKWWNSTTGGLENRPSDGIDLVPGQGVLGARMPGDRGKAHIPLLVTATEVSVRIVDDYVVTEIIQEFMNPSSERLEGVYRFGAPENALVTGFAVDRDGKLVFGRIKGKEMAKAQYESHVYEGSTEDPALLEWEDEGRYRAFIYPIEGGQKRKIYVRYTTWLERQGEKRERRLYRLPLMGANGLSPEIGEFMLSVNLRDAGADRFRANLGVFVEGETLRLRASDFQSSADFFLELFDGGIPRDRTPGWYERPAGENNPKVQRGDHAMIRLRPFTPAEERSRKLDLAILVDTSADTSPAQFQMARLLVENLVASLQPGDRVTILSGDMALRGKNAFVTVGKDDPVSLLENLSEQRKAGATDLSRLLEEGAALFGEYVPETSPVLLYVGNGVPTVGLLDPDEIARRWSELPVFVSFAAVAIAEGPGLDVLTRLAGDVRPLLVTEPGHLRQLPGWIDVLRRPQLRNAEIAFDADALLQPYPRGRFTLQAGQDLVVVGQSAGALPGKVVVRGQLDGKPWERTFSIDWTRITRGRELSRRWAWHRLLQYIRDNASPEELLDLGLRHDLVTPYTSLYVPTRAEAAQENADLRDNDEQPAEMELDGKEKRPREKDTASMSAESSEEETKSVESQLKDVPADKSMPRASAPAAAEPKPTASVREERSKKLESFSGKNVGAESDEGAAPRGQPAPASVDAPAPEPRALPGRPTASPPRRGAGGEASAEPVTTGPGQGWGGIASSGGGLGGKGGNARVQKPERFRRATTASPVPMDGEGTDDAPTGGLIRNEPPPVSTISITTQNTFIFCSDCDFSRAPSPCSPLSKLPLWQRVGGWRERLAGADAWRVMEVYTDAINRCEAPTWHARAVFVRTAASMMPNLQALLNLYKVFVPRHGFGDLLRTAILGRVSKVEDLLLVRRELGLSGTLQRVAVEEMLRKAANAQERIAILQKLRLTSPEDPWLTMQLLDLYEETQDAAAGDETIKGLYGNPLLDDELRLAAVEYYLRRKKDDPARRLLSEMVEFSPRDPGKRRKLGQLYLAFGWKAQAVREFLSFANLVQNNFDAKLHLAIAYESVGEYEKALKYIEELLTAGDPGSDSVRLARLVGCVFLARMRVDAPPATRETIFNRARMMALFNDNETIKIALTAHHPKADLELLWGPSEAELGRVPFLKPAFGMQAAILQKLPSAVLVRVERAEPASRRELKAELMVILNEGSPGEVLVRREIVFSGNKKQITLKIEGNRVSTVSEN